MAGIPTKLGMTYSMTVRAPVPTALTSVVAPTGPKTTWPHPAEERTVTTVPTGPDVGCTTSDGKGAVATALVGHTTQPTVTTETTSASPRIRRISFAPPS